MLRLRKGLREPRTFSSGWFWAKTQPPTFKEERKEDQGGSWPPDWPQCKSQGSTFQQQQQIIREAKKHESQSHAREHKKQRESAPRRPSLLEPPACSVSVGLATVLCLSVLGASELRRLFTFLCLTYFTYPSTYPRCHKWSDHIHFLWVNTILCICTCHTPESIQPSMETWASSITRLL